jgi:type IV secretory pathway VirB10-like protein
MQNNNELNFFGEKLNEQSFGLKDFVVRYLKYLPLVLIGAIISYAAARVKIRYSTEIFQANGTMLIK